ncbi:putative lipid acyl hydrolase [Rosellinia necatrix]|uniref:Putative lipid acyl hydrolase n=1 Tax=Rosellinia necatrix TaxID=77044 RepID=A0A1S8A934_ROSNE|nr:putative lipid acyl hydrolase [Rosellinia necatrix]
MAEDSPLVDVNYTGVNGSNAGPPTCCVFVLAMHPGDIHVPVRMRPYSSQTDPVPTECSLWEAAVATKASPSYYVPVQVGRDPLPYMSSELGYCNPSKEALDEGTGKTPPRLELFAVPKKSAGLLNLKKNLALIHTLSAIATGTRRVHIEITGDLILLGFGYFRFEGSEGVSYKDSYNLSTLIRFAARSPYIFNRRKRQSSWPSVPNMCHGSVLAVFINTSS